MKAERLRVVTAEPPAGRPGISLVQSRNRGKTSRLAEDKNIFQKPVVRVLPPQDRFTSRSKRRDVGAW